MKCLKNRQQLSQQTRWELQARVVEGRVSHCGQEMSPLGKRSGRRSRATGGQWSRCWRAREVATAHPQREIDSAAGSRGLKKQLQQREVLEGIEGRVRGQERVTWSVSATRAGEVAQENRVQRPRSHSWH